MKLLEANITFLTLEFLKASLIQTDSVDKANEIMSDNFGIVIFFADQSEFDLLKQDLLNINNELSDLDRAEYGDFQTNLKLAKDATFLLISKGINPELIIEPTCGKGNFIVASLNNFHNIKHIIGIEIYKPYVWETKFNIMDFFLTNPSVTRPEISINHVSVFDFNFEDIASKYSSNNILVIGNPPWVTNSKLGVLDSANLPKKTNFKKHIGLDAITGKGNFDIAEFITLTLIDTFQHLSGDILLIVKNSVIKNIVFDQRVNGYRISSIEKYSIDSKKEFNVSVEASLLYCHFKSQTSTSCQEFDFYNPLEPYLNFGWVGDKFVSNTKFYLHTHEMDGICPFVWRQGLKHDCSPIMELEKHSDKFQNNLGEQVELENELVYGLLKSSDLKNSVITEPRKYTIVTQRRIGDDTNFIKHEYPKTYRYLFKHLGYFSARKSSIYNNKPPFSIFGIGDYSFKPFKIAISGLYKTYHFTLVLPQDGKPLMLDDTCYLIGFDKLEFAVYTLILLNSEETMQFLRSITFSDAKRTFTKDVLMRIDLNVLAENFPFENVQKELGLINEKYSLDLTLNQWESFMNEMNPQNMQTTLFN